MLYEKKKLLAHRLIWAILLFLGILIPAIINLSQSDPKIVDDNGYINEYYEYSDTTSCEIEAIFNAEVSSGYMTVAFYDAEARLLDKERSYFISYGKTISSTFYIDGLVDSYEIISYDIEADSTALFIVTYIFVFFDIICFVFLICSFLLSYKIYNYNGQQIIVYAGWYHHYMKVGGIIFDEHNTILAFTPIILSSKLNDDTELRATISLTNRISLKINDRLYKGNKYHDR